MVAIAPLAKLPHARLEHLVSVKPCILAKERMRQRRDQRLGRVSQRKMTGDKARRSIDLLLAVEGVEQSGADLLDCDGQVVEPVAALAWQRGRRHVEVAREIERHGPVEQGAHGLDRLVCGGRLAIDPLERLVDRIGVGEDVVGGFPIRMLVGGAKPRDPERRRIGE